MMLPALPSEPGHSQSMSMPSKSPAAAPGPPMPPHPGSGRLPLMNRSMHDETKRSRDSFVSAASEKYFDHVQPPSEIRIFRLGYCSLRARSSSKLPRSGLGHVTSSPVTDSSAVHGFW